MKWCISEDNALFWLMLELHDYFYHLGSCHKCMWGLLTKSFDLRDYYSLGKLIYCCGDG
jgi:hypothetical protein